MARRKKKEEVVDPRFDPVTGLPIPADPVMDIVEHDAETYMGKKGHLVGHNPIIYVLPVPALSCRVILQNEGLPLSRCYQLVGEAGSYKSTMAAEWGRWHRICGGGSFLTEAEDKPTPDLRNSVNNWDVKAIRLSDADTVEEWQTKVNKGTQMLQKRLEQKGMPGRTVPFCFIVDSLTGVPSERTRKSIMESGHASPHFAIEAQLISDWLKVYPSLLRDWPMSFVGVNHLKVHRDSLTGRVDYQMPGGAALRFHCALIVELQRVGHIKEFADYKAATISMRSIKNSYGADDARICVRFKTWLQEDAEGVYRLHSRFEWWEASILFLCDGFGLTQTRKNFLMPRINAVCDFHKKRGGDEHYSYWSDRLGVPSSNAMTAHELGMELERHPDVLAELYPILGIQRNPLFEPGADFLGQLEDYAYITKQAESAAMAAERAMELEAQAEALGASTPAVPETATDGDLGAPDGL